MPEVLYICGFPINGGESNDAMIGAHRLPSLQQRLSFARLCYAIRVWSVGPPTLRDLLDAEYNVGATATSWWSYLQEDLKWCKSLTGDHFPVDDLDTITLQSSWSRGPKGWIRIARLALRLGILLETTAADVRERRRKCVKVLHQHGARLDGIDGDRGDRHPAGFLMRMWEDFHHHSGFDLAQAACSPVQCSGGPSCRQDDLLPALFEVPLDAKQSQTTHGVHPQKWSHQQLL